MKEHAPSESGRPRETREVTRPPAPGASARRPGPSPAQALALQRLAGNRAAARTLARWTPHPDKDKKGVMLPDAVADEFWRYNPPKNQ